MKKELTQSELKELLHYDPETGVFTRLKRTARCVQVGDIVGYEFKNHCGKKYLTANINYRNYKLHRLAWLYVHGRIPEQIDHINGNGLDNRLINLRAADAIENGRNQRLGVKNKSGFLGVYWYAPGNKWLAQIRVNRKYIHLGYYTDKNEAIAIRLQAERKYNFHPNHGSDRPL